MRKLIDLTGQRFGKLIVIEKVNKPEHLKGHNTFWLCKCDCGNKKIIVGDSLKRKETNSCGCYRAEIAEIAGRARLPYGQASMNALFGNYKATANRKNLIFSLSKEEFLEITSQKCFYCGLEPSNINKSKGNNGDYIYSGIDRLDNTKGYIEGNVVSCCWKCNKNKNNMNVDDFLKWIDKVYEYRHKIA
jgi:hypothetical protein